MESEDGVLKECFSCEILEKYGGFSIPAVDHRASSGQPMQICRYIKPPTKSPCAGWPLS